MPIYFETEYSDTKLIIWHIIEEESFFTASLGLQGNSQRLKKRMEFLASRWCLKTLIPTLSFSDIVKDAEGKPYLPNTNMHFSISHSYPYVAVAVSPRHSIGVDIQTIQEKILRLQTKFLDAHEMSLCKNDIKAITFAWCCKEAMYKKYGLGGIDFKRNMPISYIDIADTACTAIINFQKATIAYPQEFKGAIEPDFAWALSIV